MDQMPVNIEYRRTSIDLFHYMGIPYLVKKRFSCHFVSKCYLDSKCKKLLLQIVKKMAVLISIYYFILILVKLWLKTGVLIIYSLILHHD